MHPFKKTVLPNGSIVKKICEGSKFNWLLIPGGPGMSSEYLSSIFVNSNLLGSIHTFDLFKYKSNLNDPTILNMISEDLQTFIKNNENVILVGHSFGGMLLQTIDFKQKDNIVLICSSPDVSCFDIASENFKNFTATEKDKIFKAQAEYDLNKNNTNFKQLFKSWRPYYVLFENESDYESLIECCSFDWEFYEWGNRFFFEEFSRVGAIPPHAYVLNSKNDKLCPSILFDNHKNKLKTFELGLSAHFPWVENTDLFINTIKKIESLILSSKSEEG